LKEASFSISDQPLIEEDKAKNQRCAEPQLGARGQPDGLLRVGLCGREVTAPDEETREEQQSCRPGVRVLGETNCFI
jgi:hypothetical protein